MSDMEEPPAKRARLDVDAPASGTLNLDAPGSPMDDCDDDFYAEDAPAAPTPGAGEQGDRTSSAVAAELASAASPPIPGLGLWSEPAAAQAAVPAAVSHPDGEGPEDGELSDEESFYNEAKPGASLTPNPLAVESEPQQNGHEDPAAAAPHVPDGAVSEPVEPSEVDDDTLDVDPEAAAAAAITAAEDEGRAAFLQAAAANKDDKEAEWQLDSEASDSDSSSDSSSSDSSSEEGEESEGELLSPEEAIRRMMAEDADDAEPATGTKVKTQNETDEVFEKPDISMQPDTKITELGKVESVVENMVLIKGNASGSDKVLESGSALCLENRTIIGQVSEAIGRVQEPRYSLGFSDPTEIGTLGITKGTVIYYVDDHSKFVLTGPLRAQKHTDASGQYDEEAKVQEFSDDEEEAAHKREQKLEKQAKREVPTGPSFQPPRGPAADRPQPTPYQGGPLKYDEDDDDEDLGMYKPLARPDRFEDVVGNGAPIEDRSHVRRGMMRGRGGWPDWGRGFRGRGGRGDRGGINHGGRADRGGGNHGGRGDRGERPFRGQADRGDRSFRGQADRGRHQEQNRGRGGGQRDHSNNANNRRTAHSPGGVASPAPQMPAQGRNQGQGHNQGPGHNQNQGHNQGQGHNQPKTSSRNRKKNRKRNRNNSEARPSQPPAAANANAYASNNAQGNAGWNTASAQMSSTTYAPPTSTPAAPAPAAPYAPAPYAASAYYPQQAATPAPAAAPAAAPDQAQWAQWYQLAQVISQAQSAQQQAAQPAQHAPMAPPQQPAPYQYPYAYQQNVAPAANPAPTNTQPVGSSLSDILRALGNANQGK